jgi:hypothetical protein
MKTKYKEYNKEKVITLFPDDGKVPPRAIEAEESVIGAKAGLVDHISPVTLQFTYIA